MSHKMTAKTHEEMIDKVADKISQIPGFIKSQHDKLLEQGQFIAIDVLASIVLDYEIWRQEERKADLERLRDGKVAGSNMEHTTVNDDPDTDSFD